MKRSENLKYHSTLKSDLNPTLADFNNVLKTPQICSTQGTFLGRLSRNISTVKPGYNNVGLCDTSTRMRFVVDSS